ncbi:MAG: endonuclease domain-containing protein [bacterium]
MPFLYNHPRRKKLRKRLRVLQTQTEARLWQVLRTRKFHGLKFRRQYGIGRYVVDFYCAELRLVIEIDGDSHSHPEAQKYDRVRDSFISAHDIHILRVTNQQVRYDLEGVLGEILQYLPKPLLQQGGEVL